MTYSDFTLATVCKRFSLVLQRTPLFAPIETVEVPEWLRSTLERGMPFAFGSEKARSEFIVVPVLLAAIERSSSTLSVYSGQRLDVAPEQGLSGECDFLLTRTPPLPILQSPVVTVVEAKKHDIEAGLGQCAAQMVGARLFNEQQESTITPIFGCVTTGENWQFLQLEHNTLAIDSTRYYLVNVGDILGVFDSIAARYRSV